MTALLIIALGISGTGPSVAPKALQTGRIKGEVIAVTADRREPLAGVIVLLSGEFLPGKGAQTLSDDDGSYEYRFVRTRVPTLPDLHNDTKLETFDSFSSLDYSISPTNRMSLTFSVFPQKLDFFNLNTFNLRVVFSRLLISSSQGSSQTINELSAGATPRKVQCQQRQRH